MRSFLRGKKTNIIAALLVFLGIYDYSPTPEIVGLMNHISAFLESPEVYKVLSGLGLAALRSGVKANGSSQI